MATREKQRMGKKPPHRGTRYPAHHLTVLAIVFALVVAPLVVILTHGPGTHGAAVSELAELAEEIGAHGHTHDDTGNDRQNGPVGGHNPADHEHQFQALICQAANAPQPLPERARCSFRKSFEHLVPEGPRRPPRLV